MSIEQCSYNGGKMCRKSCFKDALLDSQAQEGGTANPVGTEEHSEPGPYMTVAQWEGLLAQVRARIAECGEQQQVEDKIKAWNDIKQDGFLTDTGSSSLPSGWYSGE